jgi:hypothetical protein
MHNDYSNLIKYYFKTIDTKEKAYWLGFLYADGYIDKKSNKLSLNLSDKDEEQIDTFLNCIGLPLSFKRYYGPYKNTGRFVQISIYCSEFVSHLINHGCLNHKTFTINLPELGSGELNLAFLLGYYDGDGTANTSIITSGSYNFLNEIKNRYTLKYSIKEKINKYGKAFILTLGTTLKRKMMDNYKYSIERKRKIYKNHYIKKNTKRYKKFNISKEKLETLILKYPYSKIGEMFGVSGNSIKKRAKSLNIKLENRLGYWTKKT